MGRWKALVVLGAAQFLMVLDTSVMNVSISQLCEDFDTDVTAIQAVITLYTLVMAAFMITGGKLGDRWGRRRTFGIGMAVYGVGSALTAVAPTLGVLVLGWSIIEGLGAALVLPALAALVGGNYAGRDRAVAYGVIGGVSGAGVAVGPLLGGWLTTYASWRIVFVGEVVIVIAALAVLSWIGDTPREGDPAKLDRVGAVLSAVGMALIVLGVLQSGSWGMLEPRNPPFTVLGFSPTLFVIAAGLAVVGLFVARQQRLEADGGEPLVRMSLFSITPLRAGLNMLTAQNLILMGVFFTVPLYLQVVLGFDAFETGLRLLPVSVTMLVAAMSGPALSRLLSPRRIVQIGLLVLVAAILVMIGTIEPTLDDAWFALSTGLMGVGLGLLASQLANVVQSSVGDSARSEVGGLQYTAQNLGSSLGTALIGSILVGALAASSAASVASDPRLSESVKNDVSVSLAAGVSFVPATEVTAKLEAANVPPAEVDALVESYESAQLDGLRVALLGAAAIAAGSLWFTRRLPAGRLDEHEAGEPASEPAPSA